MLEHAISRRRFIAASAGVAAVTLAADGMQVQQALAVEKNYEGEETVVNSTCAGCGNKCGLTAYVREGKINRVEGLAAHPFTGGHLCGRGQGIVSATYSSDRVQKPLKANGKGGFTEVGWEEAIKDIAAKLKEAGPEKTAFFQDGRGTDDYFTKRFMAAFGSANYYTDAALNDVDISSVIMAVSGAFPAPDTGKSKCIVLLDKASYEGVRPSEIEEMIHARANGAKIYDVDPRLCSFGAAMAEWVPIRPGFELAFLLGMSSYLVEEGLYDKEFIAANANGFDAYAKALKPYTLTWTSEKTGIDEGKLEEIAQALAKAAPSCYIDLQWAGTVGSGYANSAEQLRALLLLNALLGNYNQPGGYIFPKAPFLAPNALDATMFIPTSKPQAKPAGEGTFALSGAMSCQAGLRANPAAALFCESDPATDWSDTVSTVEALNAIPFKVVIDSFMTPTAKMADYVLPALTYLERPGIVGTATAMNSIATMRNQVIEPVCPDAKAVHKITVDLAKELGLSQYFTFSLDDYNEALCKAYGVQYTDLKKDGTAILPGCSLEYGSSIYYLTKSFKIDFASPAFESIGRSATPEWIDPLVVPSGDQLRLITGDQFSQARTYTLDASHLLQDAKENEFERVWVHPAAAKKAGIAHGDKVKLTSEVGSVVVHAKVTEKVHPEAVYLPPHYGRDGLDFGAKFRSLVPCRYEPDTGSAMTQEVLVSLQKEGA
ncbi:MAG: molybdopterin-dependent oxidoreductase [Gordonibacter sp.]|nr:molybdopterin-dependent oxidoreductase [Gordonibacter sp.]